MDKHCCNEMDQAVIFSCDLHVDICSCPDVLIRYIPKFDEYGIIIKDGGTSIKTIKFCPWCGSELPTSKREVWFSALEKLGFEDPSAQEIPEVFKSDSWYRNNQQE